MTRLPVFHREVPPDAARLRALRQSPHWDAMDEEDRAGLLAALVEVTDIAAEITPEGGLRLDGCDRGPLVATHKGDADHEYGLSLAPEDLPRACVAMLAHGFALGSLSWPDLVALLKAAGIEPRESAWS